MNIDNKNGGPSNFFFEIHPIFVPNSREKASTPARDFGEKLLFFRFWMNFFDGRFWNRRRRRHRCRYHRPSCGEKNTFNDPVANNSKAKTGYFLFLFLYDGRRDPFCFPFHHSVNELVMVNSQSITSFVVESTVVKLPVTLTTVVVIPFFTRKTSNWLLIP